ncbi:SpoIIE family protein phosphatase [Terrabacter sp. NPDC080008]|uniref:SpoIIE family protein phosphatase n=1 Tax=Terrabacter sp. NPDC080008 TaxID=3155176 RepID=UPI00345035FC
MTTESPSDADAPAGSTPTRRVVVALGIGAAYYLSARLGLRLSLVGNDVTPLWPPTGVAVAALLVYGRSMWPVIAVAAFAVNVPISAELAAAVGIAVGNTLAPVLAVTLLRRVGFRRQLDRQADAVAIVFIGALGSMLVSATIGTTVLLASGSITSGQVPTTLAVWWTGDAMGVLAFTPFLLCLPLFREQRSWAPRQWLQAAVVLVLTTAAVTAAALMRLPVLFLSLPVLGWAAWRLQLRGAAPAALVASTVTTWSAAEGLGQFAGRTLLQQMLILQAFNACVALTSFFLAALVSERVQAAAALATAAAELEHRVEERTRQLSAANARLVQEIEERSRAQELLSHEGTRARHEHDVAETLQRSLLPDSLPHVPGISLAARYVAATDDVQVCGDWYDVVQLPGGLVGLAVGDVAGHGLRAAATMVQVRMALRAYALQDPSPKAVMRGVHRLVARLPEPEMVTLVYLVLDPTTCELRWTNAGHPPPLVVADGAATRLSEALAPPIGVTPDSSFTEDTAILPPGATLLLYTDGLVERRGASLLDGIERLTTEVCAAPGEDSEDDLETLCDRLLHTLLDDAHVSDDVAVLAVRQLPTVDGELRLRLPAEARNLVQLRSAMRRWLARAGVPEEPAGEVLVACGEACANVVQHAYSGDPAPGALAVEARLEGGTLEIVVGDEGRWRRPAERGGGWGLQLIHALMDEVVVEHTADGTTVRLRRRIPVASPTTGGPEAPGGSGASGE